MADGRQHSGCAGERACSKLTMPSAKLEPNQIGCGKPCGALCSVAWEVMLRHACMRLIGGRGLTQLKLVHPRHALSNGCG